MLNKIDSASEPCTQFVELFTHPHHKTPWKCQIASFIVLSTKKILFSSTKNSSFFYLTSLNLNSSQSTRVICDHLHQFSPIEWSRCLLTYSTAFLPVSSTLVMSERKFFHLARMFTQHHNLNIVCKLSSNYIEIC